MSPRILIVDDEESIRYTFSAFLLDDGYHVETCESLSGCLEILGRQTFDAIFLDIGLGHDNGIDAIEQIKSIQSNCNIVIMTGSLNSTSITRAKRYGAMDYIVKPIHRPSLLYMAHKAVTQPGLTEDRVGNDC